MDLGVGESRDPTVVGEVGVAVRFSSGPLDAVV
jgi:hypothetical protein